MNWIPWLCNMLSVIPSAFLISIFTERLATRNVLSKSLPRVWYTCIHIAVTILSWKFIILQPAEFHICSLPLLPLNPWNPFDYNNDIPLCTALPHAGTLLVDLFLRCALFFFAAKLGSTLQPVGLTGGIACGKSTVANILKKGSDATETNYGASFVIIDVDAIAHNILEPLTVTSSSNTTESAYFRILNAFQGYDILQEPSPTESKNLPLKIDRRKLGSVIFKQPQQRRKLNQITHPLISKIMLKRIVKEGLFPTSKRIKVVAVDIPLLFEVGFVMKLLFGIKIVVACHPEIQLQRLIHRNDDLSKEECRDRIQSQMPIDKKVRMADIVIWNNGTFQDLVCNVEDARRQVIARKQAIWGLYVSTSILWIGIAVVFQNFWLRIF